jgi:hypothetical protein
VKATASHKTVTLDQLSFDPQVQRTEGVDHRRINQMVSGFNVLALGTITVSARSDGKYIVLDGMHRVTACRQAGYQGLLNAEVITGLTIQQEAELFLLLNATKTPTAVSKFHVRVVMGEPEAVEMNSILQAHGWTVRLSTADGTLSAIQAVERIYASGGGTKANGSHGDLLDRTLEVITAAWEHDQLAVNGSILLAVAQLLGRFGTSVDTKKLVSEMQGTRPGVLIGRAKTLRDAQGGTVPAALAKILAGMHNKKRRSNLLPEWVWIR